MNDEYYMKRALLLARRGEVRVSPNPMVGAVIVKNGRIIGEGWHRVFGGPHAEINAIGQAGKPLEGATFYITLEPCSHFGKTAPCAEKLIALKPKRVVVGTVDPNPLVAGRGIDALRRAGIETSVGVLERECRELNERFFHFMTAGLPFVTVKFAQTLDGRIATSKGHSRWISSLSSRKFAHRLRGIHDAVLVGAGTVLKDDPELTVRHVKGPNPLRVIVDSRLRIPLDAKVFHSQDGAKTLIAAAKKADRGKLPLLRKMGIEIIFPGEDGQGHVDLQELLKALGERGISSVLVEGGAGIITAFIRHKLANRMVAIIAPKIIGKGIETVGDLGNTSMDDATGIIVRKVFRKGGDIIIDGLFKPPST